MILSGRCVETPNPVFWGYREQTADGFIHSLNPSFSFPFPMEEEEQVKQNEEEASNPIFNSTPSIEYPLQSFTSMLEDETNILYLTESLQTHQESFSSLLSTNPFGPSFDLGFDPFHLTAQSMPDFNPNPQFQTTHLPETSFQAFETPQFVNLTKVLKPLELNPSVGAQPTLYQKRVANKGDTFERKRRMGNDDEGVYDDSFDGSCLNCDSDENVKSLEDFCDEKGKKKGKGGPAKNLMAERRRRKKLNDRLYMLRSVVPKISKMDRASILGDAVEYLKELLQKINDLHNELELTTPSSSVLPTDALSFHPLTPTPPTLPGRVKEELCLSPCSLPTPNGEPARVEVRMTESQSVNIHMFCARRPGLLLSTLTALDALGLDIQQAVISCFNGFVLDVFEAAQCNDDTFAVPEEIRSVLLNSARSHGSF